jgi:hypothetical protein
VETCNRGETLDYTKPALGIALDGFLYRYQETRYSESRLSLALYRFPIRKLTPCGVQIEVWGHRRFVRLDARKRYACPTEAEALESYRSRKRRQIGILKHRLAEAEAALKLQSDGERGYVDVLSEVWL